MPGLWTRTAPWIRRQTRRLHRALDAASGGAHTRPQGLVPGDSHPNEDLGVWQADEREDWSPIGRKRLAPYARNLTLGGRADRAVIN